MEKRSGNAPEVLSSFTFPTSELGDELCERDGFLVSGEVELPRAAFSANQVQHVSREYVHARRDAVFRSTGYITEYEEGIFRIMEAALGLLEAGQSSVGGVIQNTFPTQMFQGVVDVICCKLELATPDPREGSNNRTTVEDYLGTSRRVLSLAERLMTDRTTGGCLGSTGLLHSFDHQIPIGSEAMDVLVTLIATMYNGAHPEETGPAWVEQEIHDFIRSGRIFGPGWEEGGGVTTAGGTASNNTGTMIAVGCAGAGLGLKNAILKAGVEEDITVTFHGLVRDLRDLSDVEALMLCPQQINSVIQQLPKDQIGDLQRRFKKERSLLREHMKPLVLFPQSEWTHYTLAGILLEFEDIATADVRLNRHTELDIEDLKRTVAADRSENGPRPIIIALTFANTGLGRAGFNAAKMREFNAWCESEYGFTPTYIVDAAQGGILYGLNREDIDPELYDALQFVNENAITVTVDPHKLDKSVPASMLAVKHWALAKFMTARSVRHSYISSTDVAEIRESIQLSTDLASALKVHLTLGAMADGTHRKIFAPIITEALRTFQALESSSTKMNILGKEYRLRPVFAPHTGIMGCSLVPTDSSNANLHEANTAAKLLQTFLGSNGSKISASVNNLPLKSFVNGEIAQVLSGIGLEADPRSEEEINMIRLVFRQNGQGRIITDELPPYIDKVLGRVDGVECRVQDELDNSEQIRDVLELMASM